MQSFKSKKGTYTFWLDADVFQIIVKEKGVFTNVTSPSTKAKLRLLFEVAPLALLVRIPVPYTPVGCMLTNPDSEPLDIYTSIAFSIFGISLRLCPKSISSTGWPG